MTLRVAWYGRGSLQRIVGGVEWSFFNHPAKFLHDCIHVAKLVEGANVGFVATSYQLLRVYRRMKYGIQLASELRLKHRDWRILWSEFNALHDVF